MTFEVRPATGHWQPRALALLLQHTRDATAESSACLLRDQLTQGEYPASSLLMAVDEDRLLGVLFSITQPGRLAFLWPPVVDPSVSEAEAGGVISALLQQRLRDLDAADVRFCQVLLEGTARDQEHHLIAAGFVHRTDLWLMNRPTAGMPAAALPQKRTPIGDRQWLAYRPILRPKFVDVIEASWIGTQDCPYLVGRRTGEDLLDSSSLGYSEDRQNWWLLRSADRELGVLLLHDDPDEDRLEIGYMGVVPEFRGRGVGRVMVEASVQAAVVRNRSRVQVAVDSLNSFAIDVYKELGFVKSDQLGVRVWLSSLGTPARR